MVPLELITYGFSIFPEAVRLMVVAVERFVTRLELSLVELKTERFRKH